MSKEEYSLYGGKIKLEYSAHDHSYVGNGKNIAGSTKVAGLMPQPWMKPYVIKHAKIDIEIAWNKEGHTLKDFIDALGASDRYGSWAMGIGTDTHNGIQSWLESKILPKTRCQEEMNCFHAFWFFQMTYNFKPILIERPCCFTETDEDGNEVPLYAGRADAIGLLEKKRTIVDWKTSKLLQPDNWLQLASYAEALNREMEFNPKLKKEIGGKIEQIALVNVRKNGSLDVRISTNWEVEFKVFMHLFAIEEYRSAKKDKNGLLIKKK